MVWSIAGFDPSGGAGITADAMTFAAHGLFACTAITALTVQSTIGVAETEMVSPELLAHTLEHLYADLPPLGVKVGMLGGVENARVVGRFLRRLASGNDGGAPVPVVLDPVLRSSSGRELYPVAGLEVLRQEVLPYVGWITPNWTELELLSRTKVTSLEQADGAARALQNEVPQLAVVATGGEQAAPTELLVVRDRARMVFTGEHVETRATHGTGCAFSSALLADLVQGAAAEDAIRAAKHYVTEALRRAPALGSGRGPMNLLWPFEGA